MPLTLTMFYVHTRVSLASCDAARRSSSTRGCCTAGARTGAGGGACSSIYHFAGRAFRCPGPFVRVTRTAGLSAKGCRRIESMRELRRHLLALTKEVRLMLVACQLGS